MAGNGRVGLIAPVAPQSSRTGGTLGATVGVEVVEEFAGRDAGGAVGDGGGEVGLEAVEMLLVGGVGEFLVERGDPGGDGGVGGPCGEEFEGEACVGGEGGEVAAGRDEAVEEGGIGGAEGGEAGWGRGGHGKSGPLHRGRLTDLCAHQGVAPGWLARFERENEVKKDL